MADRPAVPPSGTGVRARRRGKDPRRSTVVPDVTTFLLAQPQRARAAGPAVVDVVVIGAGQAGLSAAYHLRRRGYRGVADGAGDAAPTFVLLDAEDGPGGAWRHRWESLRMATVNGIHDLPGMSQSPPDECEPSRSALPRYFGEYEDYFDLPILRPVRVRSVERVDDDPAGLLQVSTDAGTWLAGGVINATGTWRKPLWPSYPGQRDFRGEQLHTADYVAAEEFRGRHVIVVGGGISAVQHLEEISEVTSTTWVTRREPIFRDTPFDSDAGRRAVALVEERVRAGLPPRSVVSVTGLLRTPAIEAMRQRGVLDRRPMFQRIEADGVRWSDGSFQPADVILWATGFRAQLDHLRPLRLREHGGGIVMDGTQVAAEPRVHLIGYGPSSSTVGANRAGRDAVHSLTPLLRRDT